MSTINPTLPSDGDTIDAADVNNPFNTIINVINGGLDSNNITDGGLTPADLASGTGSSWAWQSWAPTYNNISVGNGTVTAKYIQIGKTVHFRWTLECGTTTTIANGATITVPVTANSELVASGGTPAIAHVLWNDSGGMFGGKGLLTTTAQLDLWFYNYAGSAGQMYTTFPTAEGTGDSLHVAGTYEAA